MTMVSPAGTGMLLTAVAQTAWTRRRTRLRTTALPTCFDTITPKRGGSADGERSRYSTA